MGASLVYLNEPNKEIEIEKGEGNYFTYCAGSMQGWRLNMVRNFFKFVKYYRFLVLNIKETDLILR